MIKIKIRTKPETIRMACGKCHGQGQLTKMQGSGFIQKPCDRCNGTGAIEHKFEHKPMETTISESFLDLFGDDIN